MDTDSAYEKVLSSVEPHLRSTGYSLLEDMKPPQTFGSRCTTFGNGSERIRLIWDGKESWFLLERVSETAEDMIRGWEEIKLVDIDPRHEGEDAVNKIAKDFEERISVYLAER